jgi:5-(carboxyamino)imidazole ribonucleotide synthase
VITAIPEAVQTIGVIGGGQLAWMLAPAARKLGLKLIVQTPNPIDPAVALADDAILAPITDVDATATLASRCDVITFENEFIDVPGLQQLVTRGVRFCPALEVLTLVLDKLDQRQFFDRIGLPNPRYASLDGAESTEALMARASDIGFPLVMKTRRLGYDGYGTFMVADPQQLQTVWDHTGKAPVLLEEFVPFQKELAVMVARSARGEVAVFPPVETQQVEQICRRVIAPASVRPEVSQQMQQLAQTLADQLQLVGIVGIECFLTQDERVLINEIAPRTHNSGHYTIDACATSQFEQQLRAISGLPLGATTLKCPQALMVNLLGLDAAPTEHQQRLQRLRELPGAEVYWYEKAPRPGRKLGHITLCLSAADAPSEIISQVEHLWYDS